MADEKESPGTSAKKKKSKYYYYVSSQSDEADTLKDKFWRNLEEGKIDVMQTPDLYSKVKCNKKPLGLLVNGFGNVESPVSTFDCSPLSSCGSSAKSFTAPFSVSGYETGSLLSNSPLVDSPMHSPFRSIAPEFGHQLISYDHSAANITSEQNIWDDLDRNSNTSSTVIISSWQSASEATTDQMPSSSDVGNLLECCQSRVVSPDTDDTLICAADSEVEFKGSKKRNPHCRRLATKRRRNNGYTSRRKPKARLLDLCNLKLDSTCENVNDLNCPLSSVEKYEQKTVFPKSKRSLVSSGSNKNMRSKRKQFYTYVDVGSDEADTLKDKFWRNLEQGILDLSETRDLYTKVKGNRKSRSWNSNSRISYDTEDVSVESSSMLLELEANTDALVNQLTDSKPCQHRTIPERNRDNEASKSATASVFTLPVAYADLTKTEVSPVLDRMEKSEIAEHLLSDNEDVEKRESLQNADDADITRKESEAALSSSSFADLSDKKSMDSLQTFGTSKSTNDSKLLGTCEVTVKRLQPNKVVFKEEVLDAEPKLDPVAENCSVVKTHFPESKATEVVISPSTPRTSQESRNSSVAEMAKFEPKESDCFDVIDFDPSSPLDDLCSSSDLEFPDILDLAASVVGSADGMVDLLAHDATVLESISEDTSSKKPISVSSLESLKFTSELYPKMRNVLMDPVNIFDSSWPNSFLSQWNQHIEEAFKHAVMLNDQQMAVMLLQVMQTKAFDLEQRDLNERTLLMQTVEQGQTEVVRALINRGALTNSRDSRGNTPLMISSQKGHHNEARLLLSHGAQIDLMNKDGETALMIAINCGSLEVIELLLLKGVNFSMTNFNHQTAMNLVKISNRNDISELLNVHINRLTQKFWLVITQTLGGVGEIVARLFPIQCFSLRDSTVFSVKFISCSKSSDGARPILFIGHTIIGEQNVHCVLHGPCAVTKVTLNGKELRSFSRDGLFLLALDCLSDGSNDLVIHTIRNEKSELKLLVCAYLVRSCHTRTDPTNPQPSK